ncbi:MAG TPA: DUF5654 family protein [Candidatus Norongarragalinales archaeon]|jgi:hypothetical protein|nr:DUF5654 family protein [Candidatus Norongarragalinales archaeon]
MRKSTEQLLEDREIEAETSDLWSSGILGRKKLIQTTLTPMEVDARIRQNMERADAVKEEYRKQLSTLLITAFGFSAALFWQNAIVEMLNSLMPFAGWQGKIAAALVVTLVAVLAVFLINRFIGKPGQKYW